MSLRIIAAYSLPVQHQAHVHSTANSYMLITSFLFSSVEYNCVMLRPNHNCVINKKVLDLLSTSETF